MKLINNEPGAWWEPLLFDHNVYGEPNEANLWALGYLAIGKPDAVDQAWRDFTTKYFNLEVTEEIIRILRPQGRILAEALNVETEPFGCTRLQIPGEWTMNGEHCECGDTVAFAYSDDEDMLYRNPFFHKMSPHVRHAELVPRYQLIRRGHQDVITEKDKATRKMLSLSDSLLQEYKELEEETDPKTFTYYLFKLEENNWHLRVMREWQLSWLKAANMLYYPEESNYTPMDIENHFQRLQELNREKDQRLIMQWYGKDIDIHRGEYLDIEGYIGMFWEYWEKVFI